jgi:hypothetical protein
MNPTITSSKIPSPAVKILCTNCIYGDYWIDRQISEQRQVSGFDCSYPIIGSKLNHNIDSELISDENIAVNCPKYRLAS